MARMISRQAPADDPEWSRIGAIYSQREALPDAMSRTLSTPNIMRLFFSC